MAKERRTFFTADWFPLYVERFEESDHVALMNCTVEGAYFRAIRRAWKKRSLPANVEVFAAKVRCSVAAAKKVLATFVPDPDDPKRVIHPVVEEIRAEQEQKYLNRRKGGIAARKSAKKSAPVNVENKDSSSITQYCSSITQTRIENKEDSSYEESKSTHTLTRACEPISDNPFLKTYFEIFPQQNLSIFQQETIVDRIRDGTRWRKALLNWKANNHVARNVANICDYYDELGAKQSGKTGTDTHRRSGKGNVSKQPRGSKTTADYLASIGARPAKT